MEKKNNLNKYKKLYVFRLYCLDTREIQGNTQKYNEIQRKKGGAGVGGEILFAIYAMYRAMQCVNVAQPCIYMLWLKDLRHNIHYHLSVTCKVKTKAVR